MSAEPGLAPRRPPGVRAEGPSRARPRVALVPWLLLVALSASLAAREAAAADGDLDPRFHGDGILHFLPTATDRADVIRLLEAPDGAVVALLATEPANPDWHARDAWRRVTPSSLSTDCRVPSDVLDDFRAQDARFDRLGRLVVAGDTHVLFDQIRIPVFVRFLYPACTLDESFGSAGVAAFVIDASTVRARVVERRSTGPLPFHHLYLAIQRLRQEEPVILMRLTDDGLLDGTFGDAGLVDLPASWPDSELVAFEVDHTGRLVVGVGMSVASDDADFGVLRVLASGAVDSSFGSGGSRRIPIDLVPEGHDSLRGMALGPDGDIALVGSAETPTGVMAAIAVLDASGELENEFAGDGTRGLGVPGRPRVHGQRVAYQGDGKLVVAGDALELSAPPLRSDTFVARLLPNGGLDTTFGASGVAIVPIDLEPGANDYVRALALISGRPLVGGLASDSSWDEAWIASLQNAYLFADGFETGGTTAW